MPARVEDQLAAELHVRLNRECEREYCPPELRKLRRWRWDLAYPDLKLAIEIQGRHHARVAAIRKDSEKNNAIVALGWRVLYYPADRVLKASFMAQIVDQVERIVCGIQQPEAETHVLSRVEK